MTIKCAEAIVVGRSHRFGTVACLHSPLAVEFAWQTIEHVMLQGGRFRT